MEEVEDGSAARPLGAVVFTALLALTLLAFGLTRAARTADDVVNTVRLTEVLPAGGSAEVRFRLTESEPRADVLIIDREGVQVRALLLGERLAAGKHKFRWDGTGDDGDPAPPGLYRLRVILAEADRDIQPPGTTRVPAPAR